MKRETFLHKYEQPVYIGDSVYARFDGYHIILETINDDSRYPSNTIALEPDVLENLLFYRKKLYEDAELIEYEEQK